MRFCDRAAVRRAFNGKRIALVGSGPGVLENRRGFVNSHDVVVRTNNYKIGPAQGFRCDVFYSFFGASIKKTSAQLRRDGVQLCICKCPDAKFLESEWHVKHGKANGVNFRYIYELRRNFWFCDTYVPELKHFIEWFWLLEGHVPTTGFAALLEIMFHEPASVYMTGFDFFASGIHNVNERWRPGDPSDPIGHSPKRERRWLQANMGAHPIQFDPSLKRIIMEPVEA